MNANGQGATERFSPGSRPARELEGLLTPLRIRG